MLMRWKSNQCVHMTQLDQCHVNIQRAALPRQCAILGQPQVCFLKLDYQPHHAALWQGLTDKQQKQAERIRRNENRVANLQREYDAISVRPCFSITTQAAWVLVNLPQSGQQCRQCLACCLQGRVSASSIVRAAACIACTEESLPARLPRSEHLRPAAAGYQSTSSTELRSKQINRLSSLWKILRKAVRASRMHCACRPSSVPWRT